MHPGRAGPRICGELLDALRGEAEHGSGVTEGEPVLAECGDGAASEGGGRFALGAGCGFALLRFFPRRAGVLWDLDRDVDVEGVGLDVEEESDDLAGDVLDLV
ncbi:hypothetical protein ACFOE1_06400 [Agromyces mediolanus]|uniref:Uncharacterized protein n=1 Tax=Agromyces mediolanus TaxID=41986 RepID=A0A918CJF7_AGRME|nr:hypothetical protein [Agromyces mediolanus]GGR27300.1 hypothetical protein GCM10010196_21090 [Agromyces mediolanus]GLJ71905.1 hypothetical protein GCM10017583_11610 [Agromyces mediolanus]